MEDVLTVFFFIILFDLTSRVKLSIKKSDWKKYFTENYYL